MKKPIVVFIHLGYWAVFLFLLAFCFFLFAPLMRDYPNQPFTTWLFYWWAPMMIGFAIVPGLISFYTNYIILFNQFLQRRRISLLIISMLVVSIFAVAIGDIFIYVMHKDVDTSPSTIFGMGIFMAFGALINGIIGLVIRGFIDFYGDIKVKEELNKKNFEMEMALVKSQLNPHFLFNTLNNIDVLIEKDAIKASTYLNKLSDIMRFMLYETKTEAIPMEKELAYVEKYIELQKIRASNPDYVKYLFSGNPENVLIPPMIFIPFIENAFKHAENKKIENAIEINISVDEHSVKFNCRNTKNNGSLNNESNGLGNELIKRRLQLLFPNKHQLQMQDNGTTYYGNLTLERLDENRLRNS